MNMFEGPFSNGFFYIFFQIYQVLLKSLDG